MSKASIRLLVVASVFALPCVSFGANLCPGAPPPAPEWLNGKVCPGAPPPAPEWLNGKLCPGAPPPAPEWLNGK
jgi:hypothetical protein